MKLPSDSEIDAAKKSAAAKGTTAELLTYDDLDVALIVHNFTPREWALHIDAQQRSVSDAKDAAYADHVVWPSAAEADALAERIPALTSLVTGDLGEAIGNIDVMPKVCRLDANTPDSELARAGLAREKANELLSRFSQPGQLSIVRFPTLDMSHEGKGFALVIKTPPKAVYRARLDVFAKAKEDASGVWDCAAQAARDFFVWSSEGDSLDPIFATYPGIVQGDLVRLFIKTGGATAKGERRRL
jgi:hypothetical protein